MKKKKSWVALDPKPTGVRLTKAIREYIKYIGDKKMEQNTSAIIRGIIYQSPEYLQWVESVKYGLK